MEFIAFLCGVIATFAVMLLLVPWIRRVPAVRWVADPSWKPVVVALMLLAIAAGLYPRSAEPPAALAMGAAGALSAPSVGPGMPAQPGAPAAPGPAPASGGRSAGSMGSAIASLEARLAQGGGTPDDWELLAKSFEFLGQPDDAARARTHQLPPVPASSDPLSIGKALPAGPMSAFPAATSPARGR